MAHLSSRRSTQQEYMKLSSSSSSSDFHLSPSYQFGDLSVMVIINRAKQCPCQKLVVFPIDHRCWRRGEETPIYDKIALGDPVQENKISIEDVSINSFIVAYKKKETISVNRMCMDYIPKRERFSMRKSSWERT